MKYMNDLLFEQLELMKQLSTQIYNAAGVKNV
jgi:hypothetical protein